MEKVSIATFGREGGGIGWVEFFNRTCPFATSPSCLSGIPIPWVELQHENASLKMAEQIAKGPGNERL